MLTTERRELNGPVQRPGIVFPAGRTQPPSLSISITNEVGPGGKMASAHSFAGAEKRRLDLASSWTTVNGRHSPADREGSASPTETITVQSSGPMRMSSNSHDAVKASGMAHHRSQDHSLTTSPSIVESQTTSGRHESPPSPPSVQMQSPPSRKRSFDGAFPTALAEPVRSSPARQPSPMRESSPMKQTPVAKQASPVRHAAPARDASPSPADQPSPVMQIEHAQQHSPEHAMPPPTQQVHATNETESRREEARPDTASTTMDLDPLKSSTAATIAPPALESTAPPASAPTAASVRSAEENHETSVRNTHPEPEPDDELRSSDHHEDDASDDEDRDDPENGEMSFSAGERGESKDRRTVAGVQLDPSGKRRKRVFSNRTKTGCMTCRKRKKKCDEAHPTCNNCNRGGFVCEGYTSRSTWQKPSQTKAPPIQSKPTGYTGSGATPTTPRYPPELQPMDENRRISESRDARAGAWATHHQPQHHPAPPPPPPPPPPPATYSQHVPHAQHVSPHQHYREAPPPPPPHPHPHPHHEVSHRAMYPPNGAVPMHHHHHQGSHGHGPPPGHAPPHQAALPAILDDPARRPSTADSSSHASHRPERDKMLRGDHFLPYTPALIADRDQCAMAVAAFNKGANPTSGFTFEERQRLFQRIVNLRPTSDPQVGGPPLEPQFVPKSGVGPGTVVEAPFECSYGYNIDIGRDCVINRDVHIYDTCSVQIGDNVVISPGVRILTSTYPIDPKERSANGLGRSLSRSIIIEDNAWIGPGATILPGVRIGRMSTVGACSLVHKDVPPMVVAAGQPARVLRGIYSQDPTDSP